jgi:hypothetical protein
MVVLERMGPNDRYFGMITERIKPRVVFLRELEYTSETTWIEVVCQTEIESFHDGAQRCALDFVILPRVVDGYP